jgi:septal ring factor EnvC (AmiA/AmiB activator)
MPRNLAGKKHQHNSRHENGLVGPGKRVTKQKSNGHLNGTAKGAVPSEPVPQQNKTDSGLTASVPDPNSTVTTDSSQDAAPSSTHPSHKLGIADPSEPKGQDKEIKWESHASTMIHPRRGDAASARSKPSQDVSALQLANTILRSRPACDTVSLLIVLLALPSMILTIVQALFASLTLMPGGGAPVSLFSLLDIFQGSAGAPSVHTIAAVDVIGFALWICLWNWAQNFALDLAQIQIAITLGNGNSGKNGGVTTFCFAAILLLHSVRSKGVRRFLFSNLVPMDLLSQLGLTDYLKYLPSDSDFGQSPGSPSKIRSLFAVHIISQAVMAIVRRRISSSNPSIGNTKSKRVDTEALAGSMSDTSALDGSTTTGISSGVDYQQPPTPGLKDGKEKVTSAKKRRRYANHIRSKQPFWAALASTKVHVLREVEHNKGLPTVANNQGSPFEVVHQDLVWITDVHPSTISFEATYSSVEQSHHSSQARDHRPFYVRINGAKWHSVALELSDSPPSSEISSSQWSGVISGLAPNCTYTCTFIGSDTDEEFASVMVKTPILLDKDLSTAMAPIPNRQSTRPSSPTTTLKNSISTAEAKVNDARNRQTKSRRQHRTNLAKIEKDVESFNTRLKASTDDTKLRQKLLQLERNTRQNEDGVADAAAAIDATPDDATEDHSALKDDYEQQAKLLAEANTALTKARSEADNETSCATNELNNVTTRKERLTGRNTKLTEQHDRINQANVQGLNEKERKAAESSAQEAEQQRREAEMTSQIRFIENELRNARMRWEANFRELDMLEKQEHQHRQMMLNNSGPLTPEGELPGTRPQPQHARPYAFGSFQAFPNSPVIQEVQSSPFLAYAKTLPSSDMRRPRSDTNRSIGALSNFSADFEDADPIPPMPTNADYEITGRKGSGSSRGKNNGSPGTIGGAFSPQRGNYSPGHVPGSTTW